MKPIPTIYEVYNTSSADVHIGTYPVLAERLQRAAGRDIARHPNQTEAAAALKAFKEATQEAVNNLARAEIDKQIHDAEAGIAYLKGQRAKLDKAGADAYEVFLRQPWPRRSGE